MGGNEQKGIEEFTENTTDIKKMEICERAIRDMEDDWQSPIYLSEQF